MLLKSHEIVAYHEFVMFNKNLIATEAGKTAWLLRAYSVPFAAIQKNGRFLTLDELGDVIRVAKLAPNAPESVYNEFRQYMS